MVKIIEVNIPLFGMASLELPILGEEIYKTDMLREKGRELYNRVINAADVTDILIQNGWVIYGEVFNLCAVNENIRTIREATLELRKLGIRLSDIYISEYNELIGLESD